MGKTIEGKDTHAKPRSRKGTQRKAMTERWMDRKMSQQPTSVCHAVGGLLQATPAAAGWHIEFRKAATCTELKTNLRWFILFPTERSEVAEFHRIERRRTEKCAGRKMKDKSARIIQTTSSSNPAIQQAIQTSNNPTIQPSSHPAIQPKNLRDKHFFLDTLCLRVYLAVASQDDRWRQTRTEQQGNSRWWT